MISVVIPVYNEEKNIPALMERLLTVLESMKRPFEVILVDDGSKDDSLAIMRRYARRPGIKVVELTRNYGQHAAIMAGFSLTKGEIVITLDADLQNPPEEIPQLVQVMLEGNYDVVGTVRRVRRDSLFRIIPSKVINYITRKITGVKMKDWGCMLRAYRRSVVEKMLACGDRGLPRGEACRQIELPLK